MESLQQGPEGQARTTRWCPLAATLLNSTAKLEANAARHPLKRVGTASEIAAAAAYLLSDNAAWMTGQVLKLDGGMSSLKI